MKIAPEPLWRVLEALPGDTQLLLLKQALETERLLAEAELVVTHYANREATEAAQQDRDETCSP